MLRPAEHTGLEEGAVEDQLRAALEQVEQADLAVWSIKLVLLLHRHPRHPSTLGGQRIAGAGQCLLLHEKPLARSLPLLLRHDRGCVSWKTPFQLLHVSLFACCHIIISLFFLKQTEATRSAHFSELADATARIPPVHPAPATITAVLAMHTG